MISIILSTHNDEQTIFYAINSILHQTYRNFELIIINDFSTDKTKEIILSFNDNRIIYLENDRNIGRSRSRNWGIKRAKGNFIAIIDGDDIAFPQRFEITRDYLINNPGVDLVASNVIFFTNNNIIGLSEFKLHGLRKFNLYLNPLQMPHSTWIARANFFKKFNYNPKVNYSEDQDLLLRAHHSSQYALLKEPLVFYRMADQISIIYKLKQVYMLFLSRMRHMHNHKLFHYFPIILTVFISSSISYIFRLNKVKPITTLNSKYQNLLNKIISK
jgi:glycosyltransferase involved in cell wall biosynthesis